MKLWPGARDASIVAAVALAVHAPSVGFGFTDLDDRDLVVDDHAFLAHWASLFRAFGRAYMHVVDPGHAYYRPLVTVSYALDAQWSGVRPFGYHATNVALHAIASVLFLAWIRRFVFPAVVAIGAALVFAVHPALASAVAWIPGRNDSLLAVFALAAWIFFLRDRDRRSGVDRALHFAFFGLALLTKETAAVLPLVWAAQAVLVPGEPGQAVRGTPGVVYVAGWTACIVAFVLAHGALHDRSSDVSALSLLLNVPILAPSFGKIVVPLNPTALAVSQDLSPWPGVLAAVGLTVATRLVSGVRVRIVALGATAFAVLLAPVLATSGTLFLDNRLYLPACGGILAIAEVVRAAVFERTEPIDRRVLGVLTGFVVLFLGAFTAGYEPSFRDRRAFAREAVAGSPHSALAHFCLGQSYQLDGDAERALAEYRTSLSLGPGEVVHNNIAVLYMRSARWSEAESELRDEIANNPRYARAYDNLAIVLHREGREDEAQAATEKARELER